MKFSSKLLKTPLHTLALAAAGICAVSASWAQAPEDSKLKLTGFLSVTGGRVLSGALGTDYIGSSTINEVECPCYTADWSVAGVYNKDFSLQPETRAGIQATYALTSQINLVGQLVMRSATKEAEISWAYGGYKFAPHWEVQLGRKRIPLYYYSDFQDIGVAYPWVNPPPELYGWDATNYNGVSLRYSTSMGDTQFTSSVFTGSEDISKSYYAKLYSPADVKVSWKNILGGDVEINQGVLTVRGVYLRADIETDGDPAALRAFGVAANLDFDNWFILSEVTQLKREFINSGYSYTAPAATLGVGLRLGKWTPFVNYAQYKESSSDLNQYMPQTYKRSSITVRYDLDSSSSIKTQIDHHLDSTQNFGGDITLLRVTYDRVF